MDDDQLKQDIGLPLAGEDNEPPVPSTDYTAEDDLDDPMDRELEHELDMTHPIADKGIRLQHNQANGGKNETEDSSYDNEDNL